MQKLGKHALDLDPRGVSPKLDPCRWSALHEIEDFAFELRVRGSGVEIGKQLGHRRPRWRVDSKYSYKCLFFEVPEPN